MALLSIICIALYLLKKDSWAYFALVAVVLSQFLTLNNWQDAKFGTIANVVILLVTIIGSFQIRFKNEYKSEVKIGLAESQKIPKSMLTEAEIAYLPEPVQKYIRYVGCVGKPTLNNFRAYFTGKIRDHAKPVWMELTSE